MGKKKVDTPEAEALRHNPFAALAGRAAPAAEPAATEAPTEEAAPSPEAPFEAKVVVRRERRGRGGKTVTRVSGVRARARVDVADRMKRALGCGARVEDEDVVLLGDLGDRAAAWLEGEGAKRVVRGS